MASTTTPVLKQAFWTPKAFTSNHTLTGTDSGLACTNAGATATVTLTLPSATPPPTATGVGKQAKGLAYQILVSAAQSIVVQPLAADTIRGLAAGAALTLTAAGQIIQLESLAPGYWEVTNGNVFPDGLTVPSGSIDITTGNIITQGLQVQGYDAVGFSGPGVELGQSAGTAYLQAYNRTTAAYIPLNIAATQIIVNGSSVQIEASNSLRFTANSTGVSFFSATPLAQSTGWGTPTGSVIVTNFPGATATLLQTSEALSAIIDTLKLYGLLGA
jgi:hypothetical protein